MATKHTPGPWHVDGLTRSGDVAVWSVHPFNQAMHSVASAHNTADARLIAAAPEMLEALGEVISAYDGMTGVILPGTWLKRARALLARVEGGK
jgi:hypothetical protein